MAQWGTWTPTRGSRCVVAQHCNRSFVDLIGVGPSSSMAWGVTIGILETM